MNQIYRLQYSAAGGYITVRGCSPFAVENFSRNLQQGIAGTYWKVILIIKGGVRQSEKGGEEYLYCPDTRIAIEGTYLFGVLPLAKYSLYVN